MNLSLVNTSRALRLRPSMAPWLPAGNESGELTLPARPLIAGTALFLGLAEHRIVRLAAREEVRQQVEHLVLVERVEQLVRHQRDLGRGLLVDVRLGDRDDLGGIFRVEEDGERLV